MGCRLFLGCRILRSFMVANRAPCCSTKHRVMAGDMAGNPTDCGTLEATRSMCGQ
jgi:hypothetical protein